MTREFVPYEEALALKELGFDEPCLGYYSALNEGRLCRYEQLEFEYCKNTLQPLVTAPLYQQAFRWFREKHDLQHSCIMFPNGKYGIGIATSKATHNLHVYDPIYNTYEEAELKCLKQLIKIVKEKK